MGMKVNLLSDGSEVYFALLKTISKRIIRVRSLKRSGKWIYGKKREIRGETLTQKHRFDRTARDN